MNLINIIFYSFSIIAIISVLIPFIKNSFWIFRVFDYPRFQKFIILFLCLVSFFILIDNPKNYDYLLLTSILLSLIYLAYLIFPYTLFGKKMIKDGVLKPNEKPLNILVCNVYQDNTSYSKLQELIDFKQPDIVFLLETDEKWQNNLKSVTYKFEYKIEVPLANTYGLLFYSKLPIKHSEINYLISDEIPSIIVDIEYNNELIRLYGIHPTPPVPQENEESTERDAEILMVGKKANEYGKASIVLGDLNDVAWSRTTRLFLKSSGLLDARRGRGMYNTFHTKYWILRWPLDHFFVSSHFRLINMKIEKSVDSDHFPISITLILRSKDDSESLESNFEVNEEVEEKIKEGIEKGDAN
jgi:endonuclease/exonuclease/phosphatase (EEP) superfamily protein YafD